MVVAYFVPEIASAAHVYFDLAKTFVKRGHEVDVITSYPRKFNLYENGAERNFPLDEIIDGINVHRCKHWTQRDNIVLRGLEHFLLPRYYFKKYRQIGKKFDVCLMYIPPLPLYYLAKKIKKYDGTPYVLNYQDFHPQELVDVGVMKNKVMIKIMEYIERQSYQNADYITVLSEGGIDYVVKKGGDSNKMSHIFNGVILEEFDKLTRRDFKKKEGVGDKVLITYAGILSPFQGIDSILDVAKRLKHEQDTIFYIVGDGMIKEHLNQKIEKENISNVKILPLQPREEYFNIVNSSDILLVSLDKRMKAPCLPGKILNILAMKKPVLAIVPNDSETARVVRKANCGIVVEPGNLKELKNAILKLKNDSELRKKLGENGRKFLEENMNLERIIMDYERIFSKITGKESCIKG